MKRFESVSFLEQYGISAKTNGLTNVLHRMIRILCHVMMVPVVLKIVRVPNDVIIPTTQRLKIFGYKLHSTVSVPVCVIIEWIFKLSIVISSIFIFDQYFIIIISSNLCVIAVP